MTTYQQLQPYIRAGIEEFKLAPAEPLKIDNVTFHQGNSSVFSFSMEINNGEFFGITHSTLTNARVDFDKMIIDTVLKVPECRFLADYKIKGHLLTFQLDSGGKFEANTSKIVLVLE